MLYLIILIFILKKYKIKIFLFGKWQNNVLLIKYYKIILLKNYKITHFSPYKKNTDLRGTYLPHIGENPPQSMWSVVVSDYPQKILNIILYVNSSM